MSESYTPESEEDDSRKVQVHCVREVRLVYGERTHHFDRRVSSSRDVDRFLREKLELHREVQEQFVVLHLDAKNKPTGWDASAKGGLSVCPVDPVDVFRVALMSAARAIVVAHNHPSGDPSPSPEDIALTQRLIDCGELLSVRVLDHVIVGEDGYFSFLDAGLVGVDR